MGPLGRLGEQRETVDRLGCVTEGENGGNNGGRPRGKMELLCLGEGERSWLRGEGAGDGADFWWAKMEENLLRGKQVVLVLAKEKEGLVFGSVREERPGL